MSVERFFGFDPGLLCLCFGAEQKKLEGIGFMTMEDVQRFLHEVCGFLGEETRGDDGMKQCPNCGDIALEEYGQGTLDMRVHVAGKSLRIKTRKTNKP